MKISLATRAAAALALLGTPACIPFTVGSTAQPVPVGTVVRSTSMYAVPNSIGDTLSDRSLSRYGVDPEVRFGLDLSLIHISEPTRPY